MQRRAESRREGMRMRYPKLPLWPHQKEAIVTIADYLDNPSTRHDGELRAALVNIPTGGGKSAVMGVVLQWHPRISRALVLAPREAIRDQLARDLSAERGLLNAVGLEPSSLPKRVVLLRGASDVPARFVDGTIYVATIQL